MAKKKKVEAPLLRRIGIAGTWRDERLCFMFHGATREAISEAMGGMKDLYTDCSVTVERTNQMRNGKCHETIVATVTEPRLDMLSEKDWPMMIGRFLVKLMPCQVTYFDDVNKLLNA